MSKFDHEAEFDDDDEFYDEDDEEELDDDEIERLMDEDEDNDDNEGFFEYWKSKELRLQEQETNIMLLKEVVQMLSKSWFWRFKKPEKKLKQVIETYSYLYDVVSE